ncbi:MAG: hypothetical protein AB1420_12215 [Bacillota bacterium]
MEIYFDRCNKDFWTFSNDQQSLRFNFCHQGKKLDNVKNFKAAYSGTGFPFITVQFSKNNLICYRWQANHWTAKEFTFNTSIEHFQVAQEKDGTCHLVLTCYSPQKNGLLHIYYYNGRWFQEGLDLVDRTRSFLKLAYLPVEKMMFLIILDKESQLLRFFAWEPQERSWKKTLSVLKLAKNSKILSIEYSSKKIHVLSFAKDYYYKLNYSEFTTNGKICTESQILLLPSIYPKECFMLKDKDMLGIICPTKGHPYIFYRNKRRVWKEQSVAGILDLSGIRAVQNSHGYISSRLSIPEMLNQPLRYPLVLKFSEFMNMIQEISQKTLLKSLPGF